MCWLTVCLIDSVGGGHVSALNVMNRKGRREKRSGGGGGGGDSFDLCINKSLQT